MLVVWIRSPVRVGFRADHLLQLTSLPRFFVRGIFRPDVVGSVAFDLASTPPSLSASSSDQSKSTIATRPSLSAALQPFPFALRLQKQSLSLDFPRQSFRHFAI